MPLRMILPAALVLVCCGSSGSLAQSELTRGATLAAACAACHGPQGYSVGRIPALQTLPPGALLTALQAFRSGARAGTVMPRLLKGLSETDLQAIAAYFAALPRP
ncbi:MAG: cytochrome c [Candidatus Tectimicrobiota bacterium]